MSEEKTTFTEAEAQKHFAVQLNGKVWGLLAKENRTAADDEEMIYAAHASCYHWLQVGKPVNHQRGEWMISHVYAVVGLAEPALRHAYRCMELTETAINDMADFDKAYAFEALARAHAVAGYEAEAKRYIELSAEAGEAITGEEDKKYFMGDFDGGEWYGLK